MCSRSAVRYPLTLMDRWTASSSHQCSHERWACAPAFSSLELAPQNATAGSPTKSVYNTLRNFQTRFVFNQETFPPHSGNAYPGHALPGHFLGQRAQVFQPVLPEASALPESCVCGAHTAGGRRRCARVLPCLTWTRRPGHQPFLLSHFPHLFPP